MQSWFGLINTIMLCTQEIVGQVQEMFKTWTSKSEYEYVIGAEKCDFDNLIYNARIQIKPDDETIVVKIDKTRTTLKQLACFSVVYTFSRLSCSVTGITKTPQIFRIDDALSNMICIIKNYNQDMTKYKASAAPKSKWRA